MFRFLFMLMTIISFAAPAHAVSAREECELDIQMKYAMVKRQDEPVLNELYLTEVATAKREFEAYADAVSEPKTGSCTTGGKSYTYTCDGVKKNRDCMPAACLKMHDRSENELFMERAAKEKFIAAKIQACVQEASKDKGNASTQTAENKKAATTESAMAEKVTALNNDLDTLKNALVTRLQALAAADKK